MKTRNRLLAASSFVMALALAVSAHAAPAKHRHSHITTHKCDHASCWQHPGRAKSFTTRDAAMAGREEIFVLEGYSPEDVKILMQATSLPPKGQVGIVSGMVFNHSSERNQKSGKLVVHTDVKADFQETLEGVTPGAGGVFLLTDYWVATLTDGRMVTQYLTINCFNWSDIVAIKPAPVNNCEDTLVALDVDDNFLHGVAGPAPLPPSAECPSAYMLPGETVWRTDFTRDCTDCNLQGEAAEVGQPLQAEALQSFRAKKVGWYVWRHAPLPVGYFELFCDVRKDGWKAGHFLTQEDFKLDTVLKVNEAFVVYEPQEVPGTWTGTKPIHWDFRRDSE
jgi:hypothetical protein